MKNVFVGVCLLGLTSAVLAQEPSGFMVGGGLSLDRGDFGEQNPWQLPMGQAVEPCLIAMNTLCLRIETRKDIPSTTEAAAQMAYKSDQSVAILLSQKLIGAKPF